MVDCPQWHCPARVERHATEQEARAQAHALNVASAELGRPLYFVEPDESDYVLDTEHSELSSDPSPHTEREA